MENFHCHRKREIRRVRIARKILFDTSANFRNSDRSRTAYYALKKNTYISILMMNFVNRYSPKL